MELVNEFTVQAPVDRVWATVGDLRQVASCLPGAEIDEVDGDTYHGRVAIKVGPIGLGLAGTATVTERDDEQHRMVVQGSARDHNGQGSAEALITVTAVAAGPDDTATDVRVVTDLGLGGRIAQFGSGLINQVSGRIVKMFVRKLSALVLEPADGQPAGAGAGAANAAAVPATTGVRTPAGAPQGLVAGTDLRSVGLAAALVALGAAVFGWSLGRTINQLSGARR